MNPRTLFRSMEATSTVHVRLIVSGTPLDTLARLGSSRIKEPSEYLKDS